MLCILIGMAQPLMDEPNIFSTWTVFFAGKIEEPKCYNIHVIPILNIRDMKTWKSKSFQKGKEISACAGWSAYFWSSLVAKEEAVYYFQQEFLILTVKPDNPTDTIIPKGKEVSACAG